MVCRLWLVVVWGILALFAVTPAEAQNESTDVGGSGNSRNQNATDVLAARTSPAPPGATQVWLQTTDDHIACAWYWAPDGKQAPGVILLHMRGSDKSAYGMMGRKLVDEGFAPIAIDLRGHGDSTGPDGKGVELESLEDSDYRAMLKDIEAAHGFLAAQPDVDGERVAVIGASIGANLAIMYAGTDRRVRTAVAMSPGLDYEGLMPTHYLERYGARALYLICARDDKYSYESCLAIGADAEQVDPLSLRVFDGKDHGTNLLDAHPGLDMTIISGWLLNHLPPKR